MLKHLNSSLKANTPKQLNQKKALFIFTFSLIFISLIYFFYWLFYGRYFEVTDNAYVAGNIIPISTQVTGNVTKLNAEDTQFVPEGQSLIELDPTDSLVNLEQAKANLALALRQTQQYFINNSQLQAVVQSRQSDLQKTKIDLQRRQTAIRRGAISQEELTHAQDNFNVANAALLQSQAQWEANIALTHKTNIINHPHVKQAMAALRKAYLDYIRNTIRAPLSGYVARRAVQIGQRVTPGQVLLAIVPLNQIWVDANFKEKQLSKIQVGQSVVLTADIYGSKIKYNGYISGFSAGTGSAFALLPPQNATGNWIKVVQRLPVRILVDEKELKAHPLRIGLSMKVTVDTYRQPKKINMLTRHSLYKTTIFNNLMVQADHIINEIVQENVLKTTDLKVAGKEPFINIKAINNHAKF
ncbi:multidrug efflux system [Legionella busanensis]|uniref:Multidrug efflux system n=1 Tax=Legionella busanensis TaxID=190655 RepID=A0A378JMJ5_9GAMM|nr:HlyD family efflux transporter periplasmic adaptor subunit [Legionella busanensis]STX51961.1 multidrug efflux system [Legionella busanensis]